MSDDLISRQAAIAKLFNELDRQDMTYYCPNCGAYMKGENNERDTF